MSVEEYERLVVLGLFSPEKRVELIEGDIVEIMPQKPTHSVALDLVEDAIRAICLVGYRVRTQRPLKLATSMPEPDLAVVQGEARTFLSSHPTTADLIVEVSDTTLEYDQTVKAAIYAAAGIEDYWIVNLNERTVEVRRQPGPSGYRSLQTFTATDAVSPLFNPTASASIADLLP